MAEVRLDKWLWAARFFKTRSLASEALRGGHVHVDGVRAKASRPVRIGDTLEIVKGPLRFVVEVVALSERRGPASEAQQLYRETAQSVAEREAAAEQRRLAALAGTTAPERRPEGKARRQLRRLRGKE